MTRIVTAKGAAVLQDITFTRAATGRIASIVTAGRPAESWAYSYDDLDRLVAATNAGNAALNNTFTYDAAHNITYNSQLGGYAYPPAGSARPHAATMAGMFAITYDAAGDQTAKTSSGLNHQLAWDAENKLASVTVGAIVDAYYYGADHGR